ncbi:MAG: hypothetical protein M9955_13690 [Rhizobiaceae bacterium]|nr:hypothetical protein [Rhizobiaceae bacterium]
MQQAEGPARPEEDIVARREWRGPMLANGTLTPELAAFCQRGVAVILATCVDGRPMAGRGFACRVDEAGTVRILLRRTGHGAFLAALRGGAAIAATFTQPPEHRSIQLKGKGATESAATVADGMALAVRSREFRDRMMMIKFTEALSNGYCFADPEDIVAIDFMPEEAFVQTPGPGAGSELKG